jgi:hypothetical protein
MEVFVPSFVLGEFRHRQAACFAAIVPETFGNSAFQRIVSPNAVAGSDPLSRLRVGICYNNLSIPFPLPQ